MRMTRIHWPIRLLACVASMISVAVLLIGLAHHGRAEPPDPPCSSCYVALVLTNECVDIYGRNCNMYGCYGGGGVCYRGCLLGMTYMGEDCANVGCGWTQSRCVNWDCYCPDWE